MKASDVLTGATYTVKIDGLLIVALVEGAREVGGRRYYDVLDTKSGKRSTVAGPAPFVAQVKDIKPNDIVTIRDGTQAYRVAAVAGNVVRLVGGPAVTRDVCHVRLEKVTAPPSAAVVPTGAGRVPTGKTPSGAPIVDSRASEVGKNGSYSPPVAKTAEELGFPRHWTEDVKAGQAKAVQRESSALAGLNEALAASRTDPAPTLMVKAKVPHLIATARAGTGKTTTLVQGMRGLMGMDPRELVTNRGTTVIEPMVQQQAIWDEMRRGGKPRTVCFAAFNRSIATELKARVPPGTKASTINGLGFGACHKAFKLKDGDGAVNEYRVGDVIRELLGRDPKDPTLYASACQLVDLARQNLTDLSADPDGALDELAAQYDVALYDDGGDYASRIFDLVPKVIERLKDVNRDGCVDFVDQVWLPVVLGLPMWEYDLLLVDEAQDLNRAQHALVLRAGRRLVLCGDPRQAIYGFAGADSASMDRMREQLDGRGGVTDLPLTVTRRCGKRIVEEARKIVPDFEAHPSNPEGVVSTARYARPSGSTEATYHGRVEDGDMVLCWKNAPLVGQCFKFIREGRKANIQGRDVGRGLVSTINKLGAESVPDLIRRLENWYARETENEQARKNPSDDRLQRLSDRFQCLLCFTEGAESVPAVVTKIESVFADHKGDGIRLSSIHKAKGLEAKRVHLLRPEGCELPAEWCRTETQREQHRNLLYVAQTRAIEELVHVS
jgi:DNA helicase-2/ATP-dependent DNA helicase PcrA